jgi:hypothetical protein
MVQRITSSTSPQLRRYINRTTGTNVMAFQFPEENLEYLRKLWKQPGAQAGDWLVRQDGPKNHQYNLRSDEEFNRIYRPPHTGRGKFEANLEKIRNDQEAEGPKKVRRRR